MNLDHTQSKRYPSHAEMQGIYAERDADIAAMRQRGVVAPPDLLAVDRLGRCRVANELWGICTQEARQALLEDPHPHVRSCAVH